MFRVTPEKITKLKTREVFVFGSNERGEHAGGAARFAYEELDARMGKGFGYTFDESNGRTFAIPTLNWIKAPLKIEEIQFYINRFLEFAKIRTDLVFYVTAIGTGIAGIPVEDIAPLFESAKIMPNVYLPRVFWDVLNKKKKEEVETVIPEIV